MKKLLWEIKPLTLPTVIKNCPKCGNNSEFKSTNNFRVNANKNNLDVWLIYQCSKCKSTWNMDILSRVNPSSIPKEDYKKFLNNDYSLAEKYAFNRSIHSKNKVSLSYDNVQYEIIGQDIDIYNLNEPIEITLICNYPINKRLDKLLSEKLNLSRDKVQKLFKENIIKTKASKEPWKMKIKDMIKLYFNKI